MPGLKSVRRAFAKQILAMAGVREPRIEAAFAAVKREQFLGAGPWRILRWSSNGYIDTPDDNPVSLYTNDLIAIDAARKINNGAPSFHATLLAAALPQPGDHIVHVGTGAGYYTAILAHLVGPTGRVTGIEFEADMAARARGNLRSAANIEILHGDGATMKFDTADVIYVNAGATQPAETWLDGLANAGRLILPLTTQDGFTAGRSAELVARSGAVFRIERKNEEYLAKWISTVAVYPCAAGRSPSTEEALSRAFANGRYKEVTRLYRHLDIPNDRCWLRTPTASLAYS